MLDRGAGRWFSRPMNPAYVVLGLLIVFALARMWDDSGEQLREEARASEEATPDRPPRTPVVSHVVAVAAIMGGGFLFNLLPEIVMNAVWPEPPVPWSGPCVEGVGPPPPDATPQERSRLEAAAWMLDQLRAQGAPDCAAGPRPLGGLDYTTSGPDLGQ